MKTFEASFPIPNLIELQSESMPNDAAEFPTAYNDTIYDVPTPLQDEPMETPTAIYQGGIAALEELMLSMDNFERDTNLTDGMQVFMESSAGEAELQPTTKVSALPSASDGANALENVITVATQQKTPDAHLLLSSTQESVTKECSQQLPDLPEWAELTWRSLPYWAGRLQKSQPAHAKKRVITLNNFKSL
jgi:hypothetical protein